MSLLRALFAPRMTAVALALTVLVGCHEPLDTTRVVPERMSLGAEIFKVVCLRVAAKDFPSDVTGYASMGLCEGRELPIESDPPTITALVNERTRVVEALDDALPEPIHDDLARFLVDIVPLYDLPGEILPRQTRATADLLDSILDDSSALGALERLAHVRGTREPRLSLGIIRPLLAYPGFDDLSGRLLAAIDDGGSAHDAWQHALEVVSLEMATSEFSSDPAGTTRTIERLRDLALTENDAFARGASAWIVRRDGRGLPVPSRRDGSFVAPIVDADSDGHADADGLGRFVDAQGNPVDVPTPFPVHGTPNHSRDSLGRALREDGTLYYEYLDTSRTLLAGLLGELAPMVTRADPQGLDLLWGAAPILGSRTSTTETFGRTVVPYSGYDTVRSPALDLLHGVASLLHREELPNALAVSRILMRDHEPVLAPVIESVWFGANRGDVYPYAALAQPNDLWDDVISATMGIAETPGLLEALVRAFTHEDSRWLGWIAANMMRYSDDVRYQTGSALNDAPVPATLSRATRWDAPEGTANESLFQRSLALIHDLNGVRLCNKEGAKLLVKAGSVTLLSWPLSRGYRACELFEIDNIAEMYADAVIGEAELVLKPGDLNALLGALNAIGLDPDDVLEDQSGIAGLTRRPTAEAIARMVFSPQNEFIRALIDPPLTRDGVPVAERYPTTAQAWEKKFFVGSRPVSFVDVLRPMLRAFKRYDPPGGRFFFGEVISSFHLHWASRNSTRTQRADPDAPFFSHQDNGRSYEAIVADLFAEGGLIERLHFLTRSLESINVNGNDGVTHMANLASLLLLHDRSCIGACTGDLGPRYRDGTTTYATNTGYRFDGLEGRPLRRVPPLYLVLDALRSMDAALDAAPERREKWDAASSTLLHQLFDVTRDGGSARIENRRGHSISLTLLPFVEERLREHIGLGDGRFWARDIEADAAELIGSASFASVVDVTESIREDAEAQDALVGLLEFLLADDSSDEALPSTTAHLGDLLQAFPNDTNIIPLVQALAPALSPDVRSAILSGTRPTTDLSVLDESLRVVRNMRERDERSTLARVFYRVVQPSVGADAETPIDVLVDVVSQVNRQEPGARTVLRYEDFQAIFETVRDLLRDEASGIERLYDVVQQRELAE
jgi:hypothetical protein